MDWQNKAPEWAAIEKNMIKWRRDLHQCPEIGLELPQTAAYVRGVLDELGIPYQSMVNGSAVVGLIEGSKPLPAGSRGRVIALRADMDGLQVEEKTGLSFASVNGNMHACGHDAHTAMLLGAAAWLSRHRDSFAGTVKLFFQPGEERPGGALPMINEGCLENPAVEAVFGIHNGKISAELPDGAIGWRVGPMMAAVDILEITITGKGGHAGYPEETIDPIPAAAEFILAVQQLISRERKPSDPAVLSITNIHGGSTMNIIPNEVKIEGTCRNSSEETRRWLAGRIREVGEHVCAAHRAQFAINHQFVFPPLINEAKMTELARQAAVKVVGAEHVVELKEPIMPGEDFACFAARVPGAYFFMSNMAPVDGQTWPHHNGKFDVDESAFIKGAMLHVQVALDFLEQV